MSISTGADIGFRKEGGPGNSVLPLLTDEKVGKVGKESYPIFIIRAPRLQITMKHKTLVYQIHLNNLELPFEC